MGTYTARLECNPDLNSARTSDEVEPLVLDGHIVEIGGESDTAHEQIVTHVVCDSVPASFRFFCSQVALKRDFRVS